jgi:hypothetical protein
MLQESSQGSPKSLDDRGGSQASRVFQGIDISRDVGYSVLTFDIETSSVIPLDIDRKEIKAFDLSAIEKRVLRYYENPPRRRARPHRIPKSRVKKLAARAKDPKKTTTVTGRISKNLFDLSYLRRFIDDRSFFRNQYLGEFMTETGRWRSPELKMEAYRRAYVPQGIVGLKHSSLIIDDPYMT